MGPTLKNLPKTSGCVLYPARNSKVPISFGSTSSTSTVRRRTKCARTWSISTIISAIRRDRSYPSIRAIVRPEHDLLPPMNLPAPGGQFGYGFGYGAGRGGYGGGYGGPPQQAGFPGGGRDFGFGGRNNLVEEAEVGVRGTCHITGIWMLR